MRNPFLSDFQRSDVAFRLARHLPRPVRDLIIDTYVRAARKRLSNRRFPDRLTVFLTDQCNLHCEHCFISKGQEKRWEMGLGEYERLFASLNGRVAQLLLTGGEPTIRQDFSEILMLADRVARVGTVSIFSNGLLWPRLEDALTRVIAQGRMKVNVQTSIDGLAESHDRQRGKPGAFDQAMKMIAMVSALRQRHPGRIGRLMVTTTISRTNLGDLRNIVRITRDTGATPAFTFVRKSTGSVRNLPDPSLVSHFEPDHYGHYLSPAEMHQAIGILDDELWSKDTGNLAYAFNRVTLQAIADSTEHEASQVSCRMGQADLIVLSDGGVARCEMLKTFAHLKDFDWDLDRLLKSTGYADHMRKTGSCWCTHDCAVGVSMLYEPRLLQNLFESSR